MTTDDRFLDELDDYLRDRVPAGRSDDLAGILAATARAPQRRWWASLERWLPMDLTTRTTAVAPSGIGRAILTALVILAIVAVAIFAAGSTRQRVPPPFGPARNGFQLTTDAGDIYRVDAASGARTPLVTGPSWDFGGYFSRDGTQFMFLRTTEVPTASNPGITLAVANADGTNVRDLFGPVGDLGWADWSPDGRRIAFNSEPDSRTSLLNVVDVASGKVTTLGVGTDVFFATWLPPDGNEIVFRRGTHDPALFAVHADGSGLRRLTPDPALYDGDYQAIAVSPDGRSITFERYTGMESRIFVLDVATGRIRMLPTPAGTWQHAYAVFSPDSSQIAYWRTADGDGNDLQLVVAPADGSSEGRVLGGSVADVWSGAGWQPVVWAPDGTGIVASIGSDEFGTQWWMPIDGSAATQLGAGASEFVDIQRLAP